MADPVAGERSSSAAGPPCGRPCRWSRTPTAALDLRLLVDAGVVEVFPGGGAVAAARLRAWAGPAAGAIVAAARRLDRLVVHGMERR